jgi:hypothetical protein
MGKAELKGFDLPRRNIAFDILEKQFEDGLDRLERVDAEVQIGPLASGEAEEPDICTNVEHRVPRFNPKAVRKIALNFKIYEECLVLLKARNEHPIREHYIK